MSAHRRLQLAGGVLLVLTAAAVAGPTLYGVDPNALDFARAASPPGGIHPLGTDEGGRDVLARLLVGARVSLAAGAAAMLLAVVVGTSVGAIAGLARPRIDAALIVIGSHNRGKAFELFVGSVTQGVIAAATVPVVVVNGLSGEGGPG